ncbi:hypothetical protein BU23DRAFT_573694 [Bimuria novae-zelandiae CBS 107.79]|uniref:Uncharacterized protein n=1 Tax=Bimuria novae-zelandiae CBS 107.79 TaxID=1447943 RepID=A0A6A5UPT3_9PLEO|nr:hypothetical protein BU23DRAFT_573694 [Bimuria novae-zelandiae CBS 107.79]
MCIIIPIDHASCAHTVALWQHCANAPRSMFGHKPCPHIRQHGRPILTRKLCHNCGGPRYFARRGGLAARGSGSSVLGELKEQKEDHGDQYDSGYQSDLIPEVDEDADDDDISLSPRQAVASTNWRAFSRQRSSNIPRSSSQKSNWRPNLKRDLSESSCSTSSISSSRCQSIDSTISRFDDENTQSFQAQLSSYNTRRLTQFLAPVIRSPSPRRKGSTLLHPSSPPLEPTEGLLRGSIISYQDLTPPATPPERPEPPKRQESTLLRPSSPQLRPTSNSPEDVGFLFNLSPSGLAASPPTLEPTPASAPVRPGFPRKNSTLLHPSPPNDEVPGPFTVPAKTIISLPPTPQTTPTAGCFKRCPSAARSTPSDDDLVLHSSHSDAEYDTEDDQSVAGSARHSSSLRTARIGRTVRASRIYFHGAQLRILQD